MTRSAAALGGLMLVAACGGDTDSNLSGEIGWRFDYADYTSNAVEDVRGCDNADNTPISSVRVRAVDPEGQVRGFDTTYGCGEGSGSRVPIRGVPAGLFDLTAEAIGGGQVLYRLEQPNFELGEAVSTTLTLPTAVGELRFRPLVEGSFNCDSRVDQVEVQLFPVVDGTPAGAPTLSRLLAEPCGGSFYEQIQIFDIPVEPREGTGGFILPRYRVVTQALDVAGVPIACAEFERAIPPGIASAVGGDENLTAAACP